MGRVFERRCLLKLAAALPVSLPLYAVADGANRHLVRHPIASTGCGHNIEAGAVALVDTSVTQFSGPGFYLYPDWGKPVVYEVRMAGERLAFHYPGENAALWHIASDSKDTEQVLFSGRVEGIVAADTLCADELANLRVLSVPALPMA